MIQTVYVNATYREVSVNDILNASYTRHQVILGVISLNNPQWGYILWSIKSWVYITKLRFKDIISQP